MSKKVVILGGGVSGSVFALTLLDKFKDDIKITIIEESDSLAKRILVSGNGRCNFYNQNLVTDSYMGKSKVQVKDILENNLGNEFFTFIKNILDIDFYLDEDRYYPFSNKSENIHKIINDKLINNKNVNILFNTKINSIRLDHDKYYINDKVFNCDKLVFALGGQSYLYSKFNKNFFNFLNVKYKEFYPSLCPIKLVGNFYKPFAGTRFFANVTLLDENNKELYSELGECLIKEDGISGVCIFNLTSYFDNRDVRKYKIKLIFNKHHDVRINLNEKNMTNYLPFKLCEFIKKACYNQKEDINKVLKFGLILPIDSLYDFKFSQVSNGGINLNEINTHDFTLKNNTKYIVLGETLDISLECGGYNLGLAMIEGYKAAKYIKF